jgi:hypothetical protein
MIVQTLGRLTALLIAMAPAVAGASQTCVQVQIAGQSAASLACLNEELQNQALAASGQAAPAAPLSAGSPANATGTFNEAGVAEQYGKNFGVSAVPYRPPTPVYSNGVP